MKKFIFIFLFIPMISFSSDKIIVLLDWFANPNHAPLIIAKEKNFFKEKNLDVVLIGPADPADPPKLVAAKKADIAITYEPLFIEQIKQGLPLVRIGTLINQPLVCLVVLKNNSIKTIADLKHKRIGYSGTSINSVILKTMLEKNGVKLEDVERINLHYNLTQALLSKKVDAIMGMMRNFEVIQLELANQPVRVFYPEKNGVPHYDELIYVAHKDNQHDPRFQRFLQALEKSVRYIKQHPEEAWQLFTKLHPELNDELNHKAWFVTLPYFKVEMDNYDKTFYQRSDSSWWLK